MAPKGQGGIEQHPTAGTFRAHAKREGYRGIGPYRAARSAADEDRRILCEASAQGKDALMVASQRLLKEAAEVSEREWASRTGLDHLASDAAAGGVAAARQSAGGDAPAVVYYTPQDKKFGRFNMYPRPANASRASRTGLDHLAPRGDVAVVASDAAAGGVAAAGQSAGGDAPEVDEEVGRPSDLDPLDPHLQPRTLQIQRLQTQTL